MSLISSLISGQKPTLQGYVQVFNVDKYRDKLEPGMDELEMSDQEFRRLKSKTKNEYPDYLRNKTEKADARYIDALRNRNLTSKEIAEKIKRDLSWVQRQVKVLEAKGLIVKVGLIKNKANPAIIWGLKS